MWRIHKNLIILARKIRITSTCVENTRLKRIALGNQQDHLHMCGEYLYNTGELAPGQGSPPHVWRIHDEHFKIWQTGRITSTCVENTHRNHPIQCFLEDHLHMCGEYITVYAVKFLLSGSPPHVWRILVLDNHDTKK